MYRYTSDDFFNMMESFFTGVDNQLDEINECLNAVNKRIDCKLAENIKEGYKIATETSVPKKKRTYKKKVTEQAKEPEIPKIEKSDAGKLADKFTELLEGKKAKAGRPKLPKPRAILE